MLYGSRVFSGGGGTPGSETDTFFDQSLFPPNWVLSLKNSQTLPHFSLNFGYFLAQNCIRKLYFMLKTPKFALIFGLSGQFFLVPHHLSPSPMWTPHLSPSRTGTEKSSRKQVPPNQKFCDKTLGPVIHFEWTVNLYICKNIEVSIYFIYFDTDELLSSTLSNWKKSTLDIHNYHLSGHNRVHFAHRLLCTVTLNSNFAILRTWNCFQLE